MGSNNLWLDIGNKVRLEKSNFIVNGYIAFKDNYGSSWVEYKLVSKETGVEKWLSINVVDDEYTLYTQSHNSSNFLETNIRTNGYSEIENESAWVDDYSGNVDVELGEEVEYKEYRNYTNNRLISIEDWDGEVEYSEGYYISKSDIEKLEEDFDYTLSKTYSSSSDGEFKSNSGKRVILVIIAILAAILVLVLSLRSCSSNKDKSLSKFISSNSNFKYVTSVTSDLDNSKKADVYSVNKTIEETTKLIIDGLNSKLKDVQENHENGTVVVVLEEELGLIYVSEDGQILIQVSSREYAYSSSTTPYRASPMTYNYYRAYYYNSFYNEDTNRYSKAPNGYTNYNSGGFTSNDNNKYKNYSNSIRQSSISSRPSSGGGTSSGK